MRIKKEPTAKYQYVFEFEFDYGLLTFCRALKSQYGTREFGFEYGSWRFNSLKFIDVIKDRFPEVAIDANMQFDIEMYDVIKKEEKLRLAHAQELKTALTTDFKVNNVKLELRPYQKIGVEFFVNSNGRAILADQMGCLAGDTDVIINRGGNARHYTLETAYRRFNGLDEDQNNWKLDSYTRSYNQQTKEFELNKIEAIIYSGEKQTFIVEAKSKNKKYHIRLTANHPIMTPDRGWVSAGKLGIGDKIITNGKLIKFCKTCQERTEHVTYQYSANKGKCKKCVYRYVRNNKPNPDYETHDKSGYVLVGALYFHPASKRNGNGSNGVRKHVLVLEAIENKVPYDTWISMCRYNTFKTKPVFIDQRKNSVHHINGIKDDNRPLNLQKLTIFEHQRLEGVNKNYRNLKETFLPDEAVITSITVGKIEDVYDIKMRAPHHSFIANGVVVHNSGKTAQALAFAAHKEISRTIVVCPASVKGVWETEVEKWTNLKSYVVKTTDSPKTLLSDVAGSDIVIINYDILKKFATELINWKAQLNVYDECHYIKSIAAKRTKLARILSNRTPYVILMSGTPFLNRPVELFTSLQIVDPNTWRDWFDYTRRYCSGRQTHFGWDASGASRIDELRERIAPYFLRRLKKDILKELPPKQYVDIPVDLSPDILDQYQLAENSFIEYLRDIKKKDKNEIMRSLQAEKLTKLNALRQLTTAGKESAAKEIIGNIIDEDEKVVVFSVYNQPLENLKKHFGAKAVLLTGKTTGCERDGLVKSFQEDPKIKVFLGGTISAGVGITLTAASNLMFIDYDWVPANHMQAADRIHRIGQTAESITIYQLFSKGTIDEKMKAILARKQKLFDKLIDGIDSTEEETTGQTSLINDLIKLYEK